MKTYKKDCFTGMLPEGGRPQKAIESPRADSDSDKNPLLPDDTASIPAQEKGAKENPLIP